MRDVKSGELGRYDDATDRGLKKRAVRKIERVFHESGRKLGTINPHSYSKGQQEVMKKKEWYCATVAACIKGAYRIDRSA